MNRQARDPAAHMVQIWTFPMNLHEMAAHTLKNLHSPSGRLGSTSSPVIAPAKMGSDSNELSSDWSVEVMSLGSSAAKASNAANAPASSTTSGEVPSSDSPATYLLTALSVIDAGRSA